MNKKNGSDFPNLLGVVLVMALLSFLSMINHEVGAWCITSTTAAIGILSYFIF